MRLPGLDPITRRRWRRFRALKRGYVSLVILLVAIGLSLAAEFIANHRAIMAGLSFRRFVKGKRNSNC